MKNLILNLEKDRQAFLFAVIGLVLILFPERVEGYVPYLLGVGCLVYALINIVVSMLYPEAETRLGDGIVRGLVGVVVLFLKGESIAILGVVWAMFSLKEVAEEIDEYRRTGTIHFINVLGILASLVLATMLLIGPFEHFSTHIRILGLEMIASVFIRRHNKIAARAAS